MNNQNIITRTVGLDGIRLCKLYEDDLERKMIRSKLTKSKGRYIGQYKCRYFYDNFGKSFSFNGSLPKKAYNDQEIIVDHHRVIEAAKAFIKPIGSYSIDDFNITQLEVCLILEVKGNPQFYINQFTDTSFLSRYKFVKEYSKKSKGRGVLFKNDSINFKIYLPESSHNTIKFELTYQRAGIRELVRRLDNLNGSNLLIKHLTKPIMYKKFFQDILRHYNNIIKLSGVNIGESTFEKRVGMCYHEAIELLKKELKCQYVFNKRKVYKLLKMLKYFYLEEHRKHPNQLIKEIDNRFEEAHIYYSLF
jgi:hypothetical protein